MGQPGTDLGQPSNLASWRLLLGLEGRSIYTSSFRARGHNHNHNWHLVVCQLAAVCMTYGKTWRNLHPFCSFVFFFGRENTFFVGKVIWNHNSYFTVHVTWFFVNPCCWWFLIEVFRTVWVIILVTVTRNFNVLRWTVQFSLPARRRPDVMEVPSLENVKLVTVGVLFNRTILKLFKMWFLAWDVYLRLFEYIWVYHVPSIAG